MTCGTAIAASAMTCIDTTTLKLVTKDATMNFCRDTTSFCLPGVSFTSAGVA